MLLVSYRQIIRLMTPLLNVTLARRRRKGKENPQRIGERRGISSLPRPEGSLVWIHAASIGEAVSSLSLIKQLKRERPDLTILQTTGTVTSAEMMANRLPPNVLHQFVPVDHPDWVSRFMDHWQPDIALWMESELWPNMLDELRRRRIPAVLVNGRLSDRSFKRWKRFPPLARLLLKSFKMILAQSKRDLAKFQDLGASNCHYLGNLKFSADKQNCKPDQLEHLSSQIGGRPLWLAASTHEGEETLVAQTHRILSLELDKPLTIIAPRHPVRSEMIHQQLKQLDLNIARRSQAEDITENTDIYLADTLGEMGLFYRISQVTFVGGSLVDDVGGHNPLEPAALDNAVLFGPHMANCRDLADDMLARGAAIEVNNAEELAKSVSEFLNMPDRLSDHQEKSQAFVDGQIRVAEDVLKQLSDLLPERLAD